MRRKFTEYGCFFGLGLLSGASFTVNTVYQRQLKLQRVWGTLDRAIEPFQDENVSLLVVAIEQGELEVVLFLIGQGAPLGETKQGVTPLYVAAKKGHFEIMKALIKHGVDVNEFSTITGETALMAAVRRGDWQCVDLLINKGANVNLRKDPRSETAFFLAAEIGDPLIFCRLLSVKDLNFAEQLTTDAKSLIALAKKYPNLYPDGRCRPATDAEIAKRLDAFKEFIKQQDDPNNIKILPDEIAKLMGHSADYMKSKRILATSRSNKEFKVNSNDAQSTVELKY